VEAPNAPAGRRTLTPSVLLAAIFLVACAVVSVGFVAARGGLQLPLASPGASGVALARPAPTSAQASVPPASSVSPTGAPTLTPAPSPSASVGPTEAPTPAATRDPLTALPGCPDHPGCYEYTIRRGDTFSTISDHWLISILTLQALNPQITDPGTIVVGQVMFLGRSPFVRLETCPDFAGCYRYVVIAGDRLSTIAGRFGLTTTAILAVNPQITDPNAIFSGEVLKLPGPA